MTAGPENQLGFTGLWIPAAVWRMADLPAQCRVLYAEINALAEGARDRGKPGCFKSTKTFALDYGVSETTMKGWIKSLKDKGLVYQISYDGRVRYLDTKEPQKVDSQKTRLSDSQETGPSDSQETRPHKEKGKENSKESRVTGVPVLELVQQSVPKKPSKMKDPLEAAIDERFLSQGDYPNFGKERAQVKKIAALAKSDRPENPEEYAMAMGAAFQWLLKEGDEWWKAQPFLPSVLANQWRRVERQMIIAVADQKKREADREFMERFRGKKTS